MSDIKELVEKIVKFRDERNWKQFHNPKDLAIDLSLEASEVLQLFLWKSDKEMEEFVKSRKEDIADELADVMNCLLLLAHDADIDLVEACRKKNVKNEAKYPVEKSRGNHKKYTEL